MKRIRIAFVAAALTTVACGDGGDEAVVATPAPTTTTTPSVTTAAPTTTTTSPTSTIAATSSAPSTTAARLQVGSTGEMSAAVLVEYLEQLAVVDEGPRVGYDRDLFPHWADVDGSGCDARQDTLLAQVTGHAQRDQFDSCVIVEGDWYSIFDGVEHAGSPSELDVDHVVALAEAWDSGADRWTVDTRREFANDPVNLIAVTAASNRSNGDRDAGEWRPNREAWCVTAAAMIGTKHRYELTVDPTEREGLADMAAACDEPGQRSVPGLAMIGTDDWHALPAVNVSVAPPTTTTTTVPPVDASTSSCAPGQVDINTADELEVQDIIHIGPVLAPDLIANRPYTSVEQLTRVSGIADARVADIIAQGLACV